MEGQNIIIIKKVKKGGHGAHGGSWKVAYADFMTAMMAFFLLLWLISMVAPEKRARVAHYFKHFSMFDKSGDTMLDANKTPSAGAIIGEEERQKPARESVEREEAAAEEESTPARQFKQALEEKVEKELGERKDQVLIQEFDGGVRIELVDSESTPMFHRGKSELTLEGKKVLKVIGENLLTNGSKVALEGHTDAFAYASKQYSNWELSTERASAARKELELGGLPPERLLRVAGFAATEPLIKDDPFDPKNRRISIVVFEPRPLAASVAEAPPVLVGSRPMEAAPQPSLSILDDPRFRSPASQAGNDTRTVSEQRPSSSSVREEPHVQVDSNPQAAPDAVLAGQVRKKIPVDPVHQYLFTQ